MLLQVGGWLVELNAATKAPEFDGLLCKIRGVQLSGIGVRGSAKTYAPDHLARSYCHVMGIALPAGCHFDGMSTLQVVLHFYRCSCACYGGTNPAAVVRLPGMPSRRACGSGQGQWAGREAAGRAHAQHQPAGRRIGQRAEVPPVGSRSRCGG